MAIGSDQNTLTVFIDFKSPYAYLAIEPTRRLAQELQIGIDWLPFVLDIPSYLGSASLDGSGEVAQQSRSADQWSKVKYAYYDCRRYANLRGVTIRGTVKIWDTNLAAIGMLWAKQQGEEILQRYIDGIYVPFWKRELDPEDFSVIEQVLAAAGACTRGFRAYSLEAGARENERIQNDAFDRGIFGVPTYVLGDQIYFGREHLPRIRWQLQGGAGTAPDVAYELMPDSRVETSSIRTLDVGIGLDDPESYLALADILELAKDLDLAVNWYALPDRGRDRPPDSDARDRAARHRRYRLENRQRDQRRYMTTDGGDGEIAARISAVLEQNHSVLQDGEVAAAWAGFSSLGGYVGSPVFRLGEETFVGRQHLPLIRARLK
jgi:2-hydroxychromene-2-carboxylate isomerase